MRKKDWFFLISIFIIAFFLRLFLLDEIPKGFHIDEVRVGYNAYTLLLTGKDENGNLLPLFYNSFSEYRPTGYFYSAVPFIPFFGLNEIMVRLPGVLYGTATVILLFFFVVHLTEKKKMAFFAALFLAICPWHIILSRATSETIGALFWTVLGLYLLFLFLDKKSKKKTFYLISSIISLIFSLFFYPSARIFVPLILLTLIKKRGNNLEKKTVIGIFFFFLIFSFFVLSKLSGNNNRFTQIAFYKNPKIPNQIESLIQGDGPKAVTRARIFHNKLVIYGQNLINQFISYLSPEFFITGEIKPQRYGFYSAQLISYTQFLLFLSGIYFLRKMKHGRFFFLWLILAILPAAVTYEDIPNIQRAVFMLPAVTIFSAQGIYFIQSQLNKRNGGLLFLFTVISIFETALFLHLYFIHQPSYQPYFRNEKSKDLALYLLKIKDDYEKIIITNNPDSHYLYLAFFGRYNPFYIQNFSSEKNKPLWEFGPFVFTKETCPSENFKQLISQGKFLFIDTGDCQKPEDKRLKLIKTFYYANGTKAYNVLEYGKKISGGGEIRTRVGMHPQGFRDLLDKPLLHPTLFIFAGVPGES